MNKPPSFPKIVALGKLPEAFGEGTLELTEKVDGSQFCFGLDAEGDLVMRSKGVQLFPPVDGMFQTACEEVQAREARIREILKPGEFCYGEFLNKPKHNTLSYERVPKGHLALFGLYNEQTGEWSDYRAVADVADHFGFDVVPNYGYVTQMANEPLEDYRRRVVDTIKQLMERESFLGKEKIEGVVAKNYQQRVHMNGQLEPVFSKYVSKDFKERHVKSWAGPKDDLNDFLNHFKGDTARWAKAVHRLRDEGKLENDPRDIPTVIKAVQADLFEEEAQAIKDFLFKHYEKQIRRICVAGLPEWFKERLLDEAIGADLAEELV